MDSIGNYYIGQGVLGATVVVLSIVVIRLYNKTERLEKENNDLRDARLADAKESRNEVASVLPGISQSLQNISDKIEISRQSRRR